MKKKIHPMISSINMICTCGNRMIIQSTLKNKTFNLDVCYKCHPFYTGKRKITDIKGRLEVFKKRLNKINYFT